MVTLTIPRRQVGYIDATDYPYVVVEMYPLIEKLSPVGLRGDDVLPNQYIERMLNFKRGCKFTIVEEVDGY